jgi:aromatic-L-amino-acid/L-tryptophan decarboxylase
MTSTSGRGREIPLAIDADEFRALGHRLVDRIAEELDRMPERNVSGHWTPASLRSLLPDELPESGEPAGRLLGDAADLLFEHGTFNGHPQFYGYITGAPAPLGMLADLLAAAVNPNVGAWALSPMASEIERQAVRWTADLVGYPSSAGGIMVSGGNMANMVCFLAARSARASWDLRTGGLGGAGARAFVVYATGETHTWIQKATDLFGMGTSVVRKVADRGGRMDVEHLRALLKTDEQEGKLPLMVVGTAGTVSTGVVDPLVDISAACKEHGVWFHIDGAYGAPAACAHDAPADLHHLALGDSLAVDPHKWLYAPLEVGCALVRDPAALHGAFHWRPPYYRFDGDEKDPPTNFHEWGLQNSRGFRALKVWLLLRQMGRRGYQQAISDDCRLARLLHACAAAHEELEAMTTSLSITTFRYVPGELRSRISEEDVGSYLDSLNEELLKTIQHEGRCYLSNAIVDGRFALRACIVNFRTDEQHVRAVPGIVTEAGRRLHTERSTAGAAPGTDR